VAILAVAIGAGLIALSRTDAAGRGMNGVLARVQETGMPMRPAMERHEVVVDGLMPRSDPESAPSPRTQVVGGLRVTLEGDAELGDTTFTYRFADAATGEPVTGLRPYLAAAGHIVVMPLDGSGFVHEHAEAENGRGEPVFALPAQRFGPELTVHANLSRPGLYRLWGQFRDADGAVRTTVFTVRVARGGTAR
jgi:P-type Cu+ transporter